MNQFKEEGKRRAELVRKALKEGRMMEFRWNSDGSGCEFYYRGEDNHGLPCTFKSALNRDNSIYVFSGEYVHIINKEGGVR